MANSGPCICVTSIPDGNVQQLFRQVNLLLQWLNSGGEDQILQIDNGRLTWVDPGSLQANGNLEDLDNVTIVNVTQNQFLAWNGSQWVNVDLPEGAAALAELTDVNLGTLNTEDFLVYGLGTWINMPKEIVNTLFSLDKLLDTTINSPQANQVLTWDGSQWVNQDLQAVPQNLGDLTDVELTTAPPTEGQVLVYDSVTQEWYPADPPKDADWFKVGTTETPGSITDNIYTQGIVSIFDDPTRKNITIYADQSGSFNTSGIENVFIGLRAGQLVNASYNVAIGTNAMRNSTGSQYNVAIGRWVMQKPNITNSVAIGFASMQFSENGLNVSIGHEAMRNSKGAQSSVFIGYWAGKDAEGSFNVGIGMFAGQNAIGSNSVFIGYCAGQNERGSNKLYIANSNTATPLIYGEFDNEYLKVNGDLELPKKIIDNQGLPGNLGQFLKTTGSGIEWADLPAVAQNLSDLGDVVLTNLQGGQFLVYNEVLGEWFNVDLPPIPQNLEDLLNVHDGNPSDGYYLVWNAGNNRWESASFPAIPQNLVDLLDVILSTPAKGQELAFDGTNWVNQDAGQLVVIKSEPNLSQSADQETGYYNASGIPFVAEGGATDSYTFTITGGSWLSGGLSDVEVGEYFYVLSLSTGSPGTIQGLITAVNGSDITVLFDQPILGPYEVAYTGPLKLSWKVRQNSTSNLGAGAVMLMAEGDGPLIDTLYGPGSIINGPNAQPQNSADSVVLGSIQSENVKQSVVVGEDTVNVNLGGGCFGHFKNVVYSGGSPSIAGFSQIVYTNPTNWASNLKVYNGVYVLVNCPTEAPGNLDQRFFRNFMAMDGVPIKADQVLHSLVIMGAGSLAGYTPQLGNTKMSIIIGRGHHLEPKISGSIIMEGAELSPGYSGRPHKITSSSPLTRLNHLTILSSGKITLHVENDYDHEGCAFFSLNTWSPSAVRQWTTYINKLHLVSAPAQATANYQVLVRSTVAGDDGEIKYVDLPAVPQNLSDLNDVVLTSLQDGQVLMYDSVLGEWYNSGLPVTSIQDLDNVANQTPADGDVLVWNDTNGWYAPEAPPDAFETEPATQDVLGWVKDDWLDQYIKRIYWATGTGTSTIDGVAQSSLGNRTFRVEVDTADGTWLTGRDALLGRWRILFASGDYAEFQSVSGTTSLRTQGYYGAQVYNDSVDSQLTEVQANWGNYTVWVYGRSSLRQGLGWTRAGSSEIVECQRRVTVADSDLPGDIQIIGRNAVATGSKIVKMGAESLALLMAQADYIKLPQYANDTDAKAGGVARGQVYINSTTGALTVVRL